VHLVLATFTAPRDGAALSLETAKFDGMPRSANLAGMADHVLAPEKMPETLLAFISHGYIADPA
jgi:chemotaxis response regulator CheB